MDTKTTHGYLVLADISGFTSFLAQSELEHANDVLSELLELLVSRLTPTLDLVEVEGDAIYVHAPETRFTRGELLLELCESTYVAFKDRVQAIRQHTTCQCNACRLIPILELKFIAHHGDYIMQTMAGKSKPIGSDVNLAHRLTKNHVSEATGWNAYALFSERALEHMSIPRDGMHEQIEAYEHLGQVKTYSLNLQERYREITATRRVFIEENEADIIITRDLPAPPAVVWDWLNDPNKRVRWEGPDNIRSELVGGRSGVGMKNHCEHGGKAGSTHSILDWKPFDYFTDEVSPTTSGQKSLHVTYRLVAIPSGTRLTIIVRALMPIPALLRPLIATMAKKIFKLEKVYARLEQQIRTEMNAQEKAA